MNPLIIIHASLGELGGIGFLWVLIELINPNPARIKRAKIVALIAVIFLFLSWFTGGYYYTNDYGDVKSVIKEGPQPWAHKVFMEVKEHVFLFLPFLALLAYFTLLKYENKIIRDRNVRISLILLSLLIFLIAFSIAGMGYLVSSGFRAALEAKVV